MPNDRPAPGVDVRVLLVEDDPRDAELTQARVRMSLPDCRFTVVDSEIPFRAALTHQAYDVIIADYNLPSFTGREALEIARALCPQVPLILISGALGEELAIELLQRGAADFVGKHRLEKLPLVVSRVLAQAEERRNLQAAERARHEAEAYYRLLIDALKDYVVVGVDALGRIHSCNQAALAILGCEAGRLLGQPAHALFLTDSDGKPAPDGLSQAAGTGSHSDERWVITPGGKRIFATVVTTAIHAQDGSLIGYSKIIRDRSEARLTAEALRRAQREAERDLTQRIAAEAALRESAERLRAALEAADAGTFRWSLEADRLLCDAALLHLLGLPADRGVLQLDELLACVHPDDRPGMAQAFLHCRERGQDLNREFRVTVAGGELRWLHGRGKTFTERGRPSYMTGALVDVNERKLAEEALQEANRRKSEFLAILAHELRNPLAPIRSGIDAMRLTQNPALLAELRQTMERQVRHMVRLIDDLMDISRIDHGRIKLERHRFDLRAALTSALEATMPLLSARAHRVTRTLPDQPVWVEADETRITQVVSNLLNNAANYTEPGGGIDLSLECDEAQARIRVRDTGIGIAAEMRETIFESFTRLPSSDRHPGGLGIGLAICARLVRMHGGRIEVHSDGPGRGSEFTVCLPTLRGLRLPKPREGQATAASGLRILVADDNADAAESLAIMLRCLGHTAQALVHSTEVLPAVSRFAPDALLMDIGMPGMDGYAVCRALRAQLDADTRPLIVAVTGWGDENDRRRSHEAGFDLHLTKPVSLGDLQRVFDRLQQRLDADASPGSPVADAADEGP